MKQKAFCVQNIIVTNVPDAEVRVTPEVLPTDPYIMVEYDLAYTGGDYDQVGAFAYIPVKIVEFFKKIDPREEEDVPLAFTYWTGYEPVHIIHWDENTWYTADGEEWEEPDAEEKEGEGE